MIYRIVKGFISGVLEASGIDTLKSAADVFMAATGIVIVGGLCVALPPVGDILALYIFICSMQNIAEEARGIYSTARGDGDIYDKAELIAHDVGMPLISVVFLTGSAKTLSKHISACKKLITGMVASEEGFVLTDFLTTTTGSNLIIDYDSFMKFATEFAEADSLSYTKSVVKETDIENLNAL